MNTPLTASAIERRLAGAEILSLFRVPGLIAPLKVLCPRARTEVQLTLHSQQLSLSCVRMDRTRTIEGRWWIQGDDKPAHFGTLSYDPEKGLSLSVKVPRSGRPACQPPLLHSESA